MARGQKGAGQVLEKSPVNVAERTKAAGCIRRCKDGVGACCLLSQAEDDTGCSGQGHAVAQGDTTRRTNDGHFLSRGEATVNLRPCMQQVITLLSSPEQYAEKGLGRTVSRPAVCPYCTSGAALEAHGYYQRWVSAFEPVGRLVRIRVRRSFCRRCELTVSLLPSFALTYRLLNSELVRWFLTGQPLRGAEQRWQALLQRYCARVERFCPQLIALIGREFGLTPPDHNGGELLLCWLLRL